MRYSHLLTNAIPRSQHLRFVRIARAGNGLSTLVTAKNEVHDTVKKSTSTQIVIGYVIAALGGMALIAHYKEDKDFDPKMSRSLNFAKRAVVKDPRFFEAVGYPRQFERIESKGDSDGISAFRVVGDDGKTAIVSFKAKGDGKENDSSALFDVLDVQLEDGTSFSALSDKELVLKKHPTASLGKTIVLPIFVGVLIGSVSSYYLIRIIRDRPSYAHKLAMDYVNANAMARTLLGHPIRSNQKEFSGTISNDAINYSVPCKGNKSEGTLLIRAFKTGKKEAAQGKNEGSKATDSAWTFTRVILKVAQSKKRKEKHVKLIDILST
uniref:Uncharacterized protein AlNc14C160G7744 n=1 Tax=Albugo laibachii Nc14 TaxID=890382 RepID=F0WMQ8_9STRA|nr:conserved hypothetical protein [Albugo laibachii Nc14]|eukprot:CCA22593.1 conserved hypothetical protein [Albugo laibachii Nc14]